MNVFIQTGVSVFRGIFQRCMVGVKYLIIFCFLSVDIFKNRKISQTFYVWKGVGTE